MKNYPRRARTPAAPWFTRLSTGTVALILLAGLMTPTKAAGPLVGCFGQEERYPGPAPGKAVVAYDAPVIRFQNAVLSAQWTVQDGTLKWVSIEDCSSGHTQRFEGDLFRLILADGTSYPSGAFQLVGTPKTMEVAAVPSASPLAERLPGRQAEVRLRSKDGSIEVRWRAILQDGANYLRQELTFIPTRDVAIRELVWLDASVSDARTMGEVDGCPVGAGPFFLGIENPHARNLAQAEAAPERLPTTAQANLSSRVTCRLPRHAALQKSARWTVSFVCGVAPAGQLRRGFLYYVERERAHPHRPFLHYNSWYDIAWAPFALNETNCLEAIRLWGERFIRRHGVKMDALVFDDGWDDPQTLWQFHAGFPRGFAPLARLAAEYQTRLGVWLSPFGGYGKPKAQRLKFGRSQGYEINRTGFSLAGPKYYAAFKDACLRMIRRYGVNYFKFDGIAAGTYARGSADYLQDTEAMQRLMLELRREEPELYINLTTGSWPSPFWLRYADSLWRQGGDMGFTGKGPKQQQWLTYRDREVYRNIVRRSPLYPLNALMTQGVAYSRHGPAGDPSFNSAGFKDDVRAFFGSGTSLQELYIQPGKLTDADWVVLAEAAQWARTNADVLVDTHWIGGDPGKLEVYGYASWSPRKGILMLRNPDDRPATFTLDVARAFELPDSAPQAYLPRSPWKDDAKKPALRARAGEPFTLELQPFEVRVLEALPLPAP